MAQLRHRAKESCCVVTKVHGNTSVKIAVLTVRVNGRVGAVSASHWHASSGSMMKKAGRRMSRQSLKTLDLIFPVSCLKPC